MSTNPTPYDVFAYRGFAYIETHPALLATLGSFYGMETAPPSRCRVLELGCGVGANLIPMAVQNPDSEFVGVDLSGRSIEFGSSQIAALGLTNISLRHASITDVTPGYGLFDYIVSHGVYSWVPAEVRDRMLAIIHDNLRPQGVAYVSYNAHPGSHLRDMVRDMMNFHVSGIGDPQERIHQARVVLKALAEASPKNTVHGAVLRDQLARVERLSDAVLFHDDLDEGAVPFLLHQVVADAERHGLQYLCDASLWRRSLERLPDTMQQALSQFAARAYMARDQYHDFIDGHGFRRTLLCHGDVRLDRDVGLDRIKRCYLACSAAPTAGEIDPGAVDVVEFKTERGDTLSTDHALTKTALLHLAQRWPGSVRYQDVIDAARDRLMAKAATRHACTDQHVETTTNALFNMACSGHLEFYAYQPFCVTEISERPEVSPLVRRQVAVGQTVTSLRHDTVMLEDEILRRFVQLVDGKRSIDQLVVDLRPVIAEFKPGEQDKLTREIVRHHLQVLARLALLVR